MWLIYWCEPDIETKLFLILMRICLIIMFGNLKTKIYRVLLWPWPTYPWAWDHRLQCTWWWVVHPLWPWYLKEAFVQTMAWYRLVGVVPGQVVWWAQCHVSGYVNGDVHPRSHPCLVIPKQTNFTNSPSSTNYEIYKTVLTFTPSWGWGHCIPVPLMYVWILFPSYKFLWWIIIKYNMMSSISST